MYLVDTAVVSEARKGAKANPGVRDFFREAAKEDAALYLSAITIGELRRGVEKIRHRGDEDQAGKLERWLYRLSNDYAEAILAFDAGMAQLWGHPRVPHPENPLDKQIAATALIYDLGVVTRNTGHFEATGVRLLSPFR